MTRHFIDLCDLSPSRFGSGVDSSHFAALREGSFGLASEEFSNDVKELIKKLRETLPDSLVEHIFLTLKALPATYRSSIRNHLIEALADRRAICEIANDISKFARIDEVEPEIDRSIFFEERMRRYLEVARGAVIADPYALTSLLDHNRERAWLVRELLRSNITSLVIHTQGKVQPNGTFAYSDQTAKEITERISSLARSETGLLLQRVRIIVYENSKRFHKRYLRFEYDRNAIDFDIDKGLETFKDKKIFTFGFRELTQPELIKYLSLLPDPTRDIRFEFIGGQIVRQ